MLGRDWGCVVYVKIEGEVCAWQRLGLCGICKDRG